MVNPRTKGQTGEREFAAWLKRNLKLEVEPQRNLEQVRFGAHIKSTGFDLVNCQPFCVEVKRVEKLSLRSWWIQCVNATTPEYPVPVVAFRQNRKKWEFLISASHIGLENGFVRLEENEGIKWFNHIVDSDAA